MKNISDNYKKFNIFSCQTSRIVTELRGSRPYVHAVLKLRYDLCVLELIFLRIHEGRPLYRAIF